MAGNSKPTLFIIEDEPAWAASLTAKFTKKYAISHFTSGEAFLEKLDANPGIAILDFHLEGAMNGLDVLKAIKQRSPKTFVVLFSAQEDVQIALDTLDSGAFDYVVKGDNALQRLQIIVRNIEQQEKLNSQIVELNIRVQRWKLALILLISAIVIGSAIIYLNVCPQNRAIKWDPFNMREKTGCV